MARPDGILTTRGQSFLASGVVLLAAGFTLGLGDLMRLGLLLLLLAVAAWLLARRPARSLVTRRDVTPARLTVGEAGTVSLLVTNEGRRRSPFLIAQEQLSYALGDRPRFVVPGLRPGQQQLVRYPVRSVLRGEHELGPLSVRVRDAFGLTSRLTRCSGGGSVLVVPRVLPLDGGGMPGAAPGQDESVADMVALHGEDDVTIRHYRQGDELRRIHWPASAHTGSLMVRQEEQPARRRAAVVLDRRASAHAGDGTRSSFEWAVTAAASVVAHLIAHGYDVDLVCDDSHAHERPVSVDEALEMLARVDLGDADSLAAAARSVGRRPVGVVVAVVGAGDTRGLEDLLTARRSGMTPIALVVDARRFTSSDVGGNAGGGGGGGAGADAGGPGSPAVARQLAAAGWRTAVAGPGTDPAVTWGQAAARTQGALR
ncbi:DUF58 domain-containing protein [Arsenicicoccus sp. oral taxon 190]|uniref:DUF58 domain-containing protein n=1 Tax=Arsenicicoccus sp. oral taxon 190 TaxID=1658671 RepID=UPI00067CA34F|nr:DUF58 domain-containing protein [Arsenicicoccus sp. oral taxon 190]